MNTWCTSVVVFCSLVFPLSSLTCCAAPSTTAAAPVGTIAASSDAETPAVPYLIRRDDEIDVTVAGHDELKGTFVVLPDGSITVPGAGAIPVSGMTVAALTTMLTSRFGKTINQPDVTVNVKPSLNSVAKVSVLGGVKSPGQYQIPEDAHILDIIAAAGGLTSDPSLSKGTLIRSGGAETIPIDFSNLYAEPTSYQNISVKPGDVLLVEAREAFQVQLAGEIAKPGAYPVGRDGSPIFDLILQAGGATPAASLKEAQIMHDGRLQIVDLRSYGTDLTGPASTHRLMPGDVLLVPKIIDRYAVLGEVRSPGAYDIPDGHTISLRSALISAGGTSDDADIKNVSLLHSNPTGKATATPINVAALLTGKVPDVTLQAGDIIYVPVEHAKAPFNPLSLVSLVPIIGLFR